MIPANDVELVVARFTYVSHINPLYPLISMTRKKHTPSASMSVVRNWFDRVVNAEKANLLPHQEMRFAEYRIQSGDTELFKIDGVRFDKILVVIGDEYTYWNFYQNLEHMHNVEGEGSLPISFCACCFQAHYQPIIRTIKNSLDLPHSREVYC